LGELILSIINEYKPYLLALLLSLARPHAFLSASQVLAPSAVPRMARNAAILTMVIPIVPVNIAYARIIEPSLFTYVLLFAKEYALGFLMGYGVAWLFWAVQTAGDFIDNQRGAAIASSIDPLQGHEASPLGNLFSQAFVTYFFSAGGFLLVLKLLYTSFSAWPVMRGLPLLSPELPALALTIMDSGMRLMFVLAAPAIAIMFLAEFSLAIVSRFAPQLQVFILAMPIKSGLALMILIFYFATMFDVAYKNSTSFEPYIRRLYAILQAGDKAAQTITWPTVPTIPAPGDKDR
jgi:type III secretion protein T